MEHEFDQRRKANYPGRSPIDVAAMRFVQSWHRHPDLHDLLWYKGVNLGEACEYDTLPIVLEALVDNEEEPSP